LYKANAEITQKGIINREPLRLKTKKLHQIQSSLEPLFKKNKRIELHHEIV